MLLRELDFTPNRDFMQTQPHINAQMRAMLNDWLIGLCMMLGMRRETLWLTVNLVDRYLCCVEVMMQHLQLVGVSALLAAAKFEEVNPPEVKDLAYYTANTYTREEIIQCEASILVSLSFKVAGPTAAHFLVHFQVASAEPGEGGQPLRDDLRADLEWHLLECALQDYRTVGQRPSKLAASALVLSSELSGRRQAWPETLARVSGHSQESLEPCVALLRDLLAAGVRSSTAPAAAR
mmetsp:Transcript_111141/g.310916  ORF Transcript_111141/g.310916 Transcript_111141/m.310916 type:complete len:236 (+) Transcript_111141:250-957(+)